MAKARAKSKSKTLRARAGRATRQYGRKLRKRASKGATRLNRQTRRWIRAAPGRGRRKARRIYRGAARWFRQKNRLFRTRIKANRRAIEAERKRIGQLRGIVERAKVRTITQAVYLVRRLALKMIRFRKDRMQASAPGQAPYTHSLRLRKAIQYKATKRRAVVGPSKRVIGIVGGVHERGGTYKGQRFAARPFMGPAASEAAKKIPKIWRQSIRK